MTTSAPVNISTLIQSRPGVMGGRPCLAGSRVSIDAVAGRHQRGDSPEQMAEDWPHLDLGRIYAGLAYYYANKAMIDAEIAEDEAFADKMMAKYPNGIRGDVDVEGLSLLLDEQRIRVAKITTSAPVNISRLIQSKPGVMGGRPCLAGSRVSVNVLAMRHQRGDSPEQMQEDWPHLDLGRIYAGLAYYYANKQCIDAENAADIALEEELAAKYPDGMRGTPEL